MKQFIIKESFVNGKMDYIKVNAETETEAKKIYRDIKNVKRMSKGMSISDYDKWSKSMNFSAEISAKKKDKELTKAKIDFVNKLTAIN